MAIPVYVCLYIGRGLAFAFLHSGLPEPSQKVCRAVCTLFLYLQYNLKNIHGTMKKLFLFFAVVVLGIASAVSQKFVIDPLLSDSVKAYEVVLKDSSWVAKKNYASVMLPKGHEFDNVNTLKEDDKLIMRYNGKLYEVSKADVIFSENNPEGVENPLSERSKIRHSQIGRFYMSLYPIGIMIVLLLAAAIMSILYTKTRIQILRLPTLIAVPATILVASLIEIFGVMTLGDEFFWWCDFDKNGFWASLVILVPFAAVVAFQLYSIKLYERVVFDGDESKKISIKPVAWSLALCLPVTVGAMLIWILALGLKQDFVFEVVMLTVFFVTLGLGLFVTLKRNISTLGFINGILITAFSVVYIIGCIMSVWAVIVIVFKMILTIIAFVVCAFLLMMVGGRRRFRGSDGRIYEEI